MSETILTAVMPEAHGNESQCKVVSEPTIARKLIKMGYKVVDIKPKKKFPRETVFVFEIVDGFMDQLNKYLEEKQQE